MEFIDIAFYSIKRTVQGIKRGRCYTLTDAESIFAVNAWFACNREKHQKNIYCLEC